jgi:lipid A 3-O-deacylase
MKMEVAKRVFRVAAMGLLAGVAYPAQADPNLPTDRRATVEVSAGAFGIFDDSKEPMRLGLEYLGKPFSPWCLTPGIGINLTEGGARFIYLDLRKDWWLGSHWSGSAFVGAGLFHDGGGLHLGSDVEFRSGIAMSRVLGERLRIGIAGYHLSNGGISDHNPGTEVAAMLFTFPIGKPAATVGG